VTPAGGRKLEALRRQRNDWLAARLVRLPPEERARLAEAAAPLLKLVSLEA
jgi:DNA-binding MarR family transcriptional regulator